MARALFAAAFVLAWLLGLAEASARPGGGDTFSGPSDSGGGHGHGDGGEGIELLFFLLRLVLMYPKVGVPLLVIGVIVFLVVARRQGLENWDSPHVPHVSAEPRRSARRSASDLQEQLRGLRQLDPDFSRVLLEDFAYRLYASVQRAQGDAAALAGLAPYLADSVRTQLATARGRIESVIVGALRIEHIALPATSAQGQVQLRLSYESNMRVHGAGSRYVRERWLLARDKDARTKPPGSDERLGCPNCGAPFRASDSRRCEYCQQVVGDGRFNWVVVQRQVLEEQPVLGGLGQQVEERGTDRPSVFAPDLEAEWQALMAQDPALSASDLERRLALIYDTLNRAYGARALASVRGFVSDGMFDYLSYWVEAYRAAGLRNALEEMRIERVERVKVVRDRFFDAVTFRLFASGRDYTVRADSGEHVSGDAEHARRYSEYWTLIRSAATRGPARTEASCPNCAAPLSVSMAGVCTHCGAHITRGEFDWVLSKIEQDDVYDG